MGKGPVSRKKTKPDIIESSLSSICLQKSPCTRLKGKTQGHRDMIVGIRRLVELQVRSQDACTRQLRPGFQGRGPPRRTRRRIRRPAPKRTKVQRMRFPAHVQKEGALCPCRRRCHAPALCGNRLRHRRPLRRRLKNAVQEGRLQVCGQASAPCRQWIAAVLLESPRRP